MHRTFFLFFLLSNLSLLSCQSQQHGQATNGSSKTTVGGPFENREFLYQKMPESIGPIDTSAGWSQNGPKVLVTGTVLKPDGLTPAPGVIIYYYHTNIKGRYQHLPELPQSMPPNEKGQTHGYIRGWVKTNAKGEYFIYTVRPGTYPTRDEPDHIHLTVKEPNEISEYYIDDIVFDDDPLLTTAKRVSQENRGGSGLVRLVMKQNMWVGKRNIGLGLNIPGHPQVQVAKNL